VGKVFPLQVGDNLVGRWDPDSGAFPEVDLETDDPEARISRKHALIRVSDQIEIEDIGSLNGTFVNRGPRLEPGSPVTLKDGDEIIIGKTFFKVSLA
jgi:pSer/pThr/pTyr-binding forkhead associated (FHA) protein